MSPEAFEAELLRRLPETSVLRADPSGEAWLWPAARAALADTPALQDVLDAVVSLEIEMSAFGDLDSALGSQRWGEAVSTSPAPPEDLAAPWSKRSGGLAARVMGQIPEGPARLDPRLRSTVLGLAYLGAALAALLVLGPWVVAEAEQGTVLEKLHGGAEYLHQLAGELRPESADRGETP